MALREASLVVRPGEFVVITGPSGSGKTTLLHLAALLERPTQGSVTFEGRETDRLSETETSEIRKRRIGMVFQRFCLLPHRTVLENVLFRYRYVGLPGAADRERAMGLLAELGLEGAAHRRARVLSAGEMQRVAIARAVVLQPAILVADEPTGNLDAAATHRVMACFADLHRRGLTILMVTHNEHLTAYGTRHCVCRDGVLAN